MKVDQYRWTQHDRYWRDDFKLVAEDLGCKWLRYSIPWHLIEKRPGVFDWKVADQRIGFARELGIELMLDLAHFGTPAWLPEAFGDLDFPKAFERFAAEFGRRYSGQVRSMCPINEPLITALFCGDVGLWPPHGRSLRSYMAVLCRIVLALNWSIRALRETMSGVEIVVCDALETAKVCEDKHTTLDPLLCESMRADANRRMWRRHLVLDLLMGRVDHEHRLYPWLTQNGFPAMELNWFSRNAISPDLLGLDYYPHTEVELYAAGDGGFRQRVPEQLTGLYRAALDYWQRYKLPIMITETSFTGSDLERGEWLQFTVDGVRRLRSEGVPVIGYTWWPLFDHMDWDGALLHQMGHIHPVGIYRLERSATGRLRRVPTTLRESYRVLIEQGDEAAGKLARRAVRKTASNRSQRVVERQSAKLSYPIIVHCHLRWDGVWQRPQQFLSRLSARHRVLFVEGPLLVEGKRAPQYRVLQTPNHPNVTVLQMDFPMHRFQDGAWVDGERRRLLQEALNGPLAGQFERPVQWFYDPMAVPSFLGQMNEIAVVYDCMDELSQFRFAPPEIVVRERMLLKQADVVFAGGRKLYESKSRHHPNCHFYGCGVDVDHFSKARLSETEVPHDVNFVPRPILGYFGVVDERLDYELISKLAESNPNWSVVMIGPVAKVDPAALPRRVNLFWVGRREYTQLPAYVKAFDVCLMPFALNESTEYINPTKTLEYMATGRPVVSTGVADVISNFGDVVSVAHSSDEFVELCRKAIENRDENVIRQGIERAQQNQWENIVEKLEKHIDDVLKTKGLTDWARHSTPAVENPEPARVPVAQGY